MNIGINTYEPSEKKFACPIVFVHGMWHDQRCWDEFIPHFTEAGYVCHSFNLTKHGIGKNPKGIRWVGIKQYVSDLRDVIGQLEHTPIVIGHSMGGFIIQKYLERDELDKVVLIASIPHTGMLKPTIRFAKKYPLLFLKMNLTMNMISMITSKERYKWSYHSDDIEEDRLDVYYGQTGNESYRAYLDALIFKLPKIKPNNCRKLVISGGNDSTISPQQLVSTANKLEADYLNYTEMPHSIMQDKDNAQVAKDIMAWLTK
jgi:pimeloyl-ACP methyl ester carboxylesterase